MWCNGSIAKQKNYPVKDKFCNKLSYNSVKVLVCGSNPTISTKLICPCSPIGRGNRFKICRVSVRIWPRVPVTEDAVRWFLHLLGKQATGASRWGFDSSFFRHVSVVQRTEYIPPKNGIQARFLSETPRCFLATMLKNTWQITLILLYYVLVSFIRMDSALNNTIRTKELSLSGGPP